MFVQRLTTQLTQLQELGMAVLGFVEHEIGLASEEKPVLERDEFNLHKLIILVTEPGKVNVPDRLQLSTFPTLHRFSTCFNLD
jgi:hypothetical protein